MLLAGPVEGECACIGRESLSECDFVQHLLVEGGDPVQAFIVLHLRMILLDDGVEFGEVGIAEEQEVGVYTKDVADFFGCQVRVVAAEDGDIFYFPGDSKLEGDYVCDFSGVGDVGVDVAQGAEEIAMEVEVSLLDVVHGVEAIVGDIKTLTDGIKVNFEGSNLLNEVFFLGFLLAEPFVPGLAAGAGCLE